MTFRFTALWLFLCAPLTANARGHRPAKEASTLRAEDNPKLAGDARAFAAARVAFLSPSDGVELPALGGVPIQLEVQGYALGPVPRAAQSDLRAPANSAPFALLLVDNDGALRIDDARSPLRLTGLLPGPHTLRVVLSRPWGEVVKAKDAFAMTRFWMGSRPAKESAARAAELTSWPDPKRPILTYVFPLGELRGGLGLFSDAPAAAEPSDGGAASIAANGGASSAADGGAASNAAATASGQPLALPEPLALDFYLSGASLREHGRGNKVRIVVDKRELPIVRAWRPLKLRLASGRNQVTIDLLDRRSTKVKNAVNRTDRLVTAP